MSAPSDLLDGESGEPTLDQVDPRSALGCEVNLEARSFHEPTTDQSGLVGPVVVHDQVHVEISGDCLFDGVEELPELHRAMTAVALADHSSAGCVERGEQRGGSVPLVVMGAQLWLTGPHGQQRLGAIEGLDLGFLVDTQHKGLVRRIEVEAHDVSDLVDEQRVRGELEGLAPMRLKPKGTQIRVIALWLSPTRLAIERVLQCVASLGLLSRVRVTTRSTAASLILRGAPGRGSSSSPSALFSKNRPRHFPTVPRLICRRCATSMSKPPSAHARTMRARSAKACAVVRRATQLSSVRRSSGVKAKLAFGRPVRICALLVQENADGHDFVYLFLTRDTSDAAAVLDPSSSHGVLRALMTGMMAGWLAAQALRSPALEAQCVRAYHEWLLAWFESDAAQMVTAYRRARLFGLGGVLGRIP